MSTNQDTGVCECEAGYHLTDLGCVDCQYLIPGCRTCSHTADTDTGFQLISERVFGTIGSVDTYVTCDICQSSARYVESPAGEPVKCSACAERFDGCSSCGTYGDTCDQCYQTHVLEAVDADGLIPCTRCDYFMFNCLTCFDKTECRSEKPRLLF